MSHMCLFLLLTIQFGQVILIARGDDLSSLSGRRLHDNLFRDYKPAVRPVLNVSQPTEVGVEFQIFQLFGVDVLQQSLKSKCSVFLKWKDEFLTWNPEEYDNITRAVFRYDENIWVPDIVIVNSLGNPHDLGLDDTHVILNFKGEIVIWTSVTLDSYCAVKTKQFPFDKHDCEIYLSPELSNDEIVVLKPYGDNLNINGEFAVAEWDVVEHHIEAKREYFHCTYFLCNDNEEEIGFTTLNYQIKLQRTCQLCVFNIIVPVIVLAALNLLTFYVPCESGEKTTFPISLFLTLAVFLTMISSSLPESIDGMSYISMYVTFHFMVGAITLLATVVSINLYHKQGEGSVFSKAIVVLLKPFINKKTCVYDDKSTENNTNQANIKEGESGHEFTGPTLQETAYGWNEVSKAFDRLVFYVLAVSEFIALFAFLMLMSA